MAHDDVIKWKHFPRYWPFVQRVHWSPVNSPRKGQWRGALMFTLICAQINGWGTRVAGDLRRHRDHYDVMCRKGWWCNYEFGLDPRRVAYFLSCALCIVVPVYPKPLLVVWHMGPNHFCVMCCAFVFLSKRRCEDFRDFKVTFQCHFVLSRCQ